MQKTWIDGSVEKYEEFNAFEYSFVKMSIFHKFKIINC